MIKVKRDQIARSPNIGVTLNARQWWVLGWRHARLLYRRWSNVAWLGTGDPKVDSARRQAPLAFKCLVAREKSRVFSGEKWGYREDWGVFKLISGGWHYSRPDRYFKRKCPLP